MEGYSSTSCCSSIFGPLPSALSHPHAPPTGTDYDSATVAIITFVVNNHLMDKYGRDTNNGKAKAWEKRFLEIMENLTKNGMEHFTISYSAEVYSNYCYVSWFLSAGHVVLVLPFTAINLPPSLPPSLRHLPATLLLSITSPLSLPLLSLHPSLPPSLPP